MNRSLAQISVLSFPHSPYLHIQVGKVLWAEIRLHQGNRCYFLWFVERSPNTRPPSIHCSINHGAQAIRFKDLYFHARSNSKSVLDWGEACLFEEKQDTCTLELFQTPRWPDLNSLLISWVISGQYLPGIQPQNPGKKMGAESGISRRMAKMGLKTIEKRYH